jgi:hypothetical protein
MLGKFCTKLCQIFVVSLLCYVKMKVIPVNGQSSSKIPDRIMYEIKYTINNINFTEGNYWEIKQLCQSASPKPLQSYKTRDNGVHFY